MPTVFRERGYRVFFYANEGTPLEPMHVHVWNAGRAAKFWVHAGVQLAEARGFTSNELRWIEQSILDHLGEIREAWNERFGA